MKFGWINVYNIIILILMMIPNIIYVFKYKDEKNKCENVFMNILEQIGRYSCMFLMVFPLVVWKFGYASVTEAVIYFICNILLLISYWIIFFINMNNKNKYLAIILAILPTLMFLISGIILRHWLLVIFSLIFGISHIYITYKNN